jgi:predicted hydrolase (HD superfamily)
MMSGQPAEESRVALPRAEFPRLIRRFVDSARAARLNPDDLAWAASLLTPAEYALWVRLAAHDQVHAVCVAKVTRSKLAGSAYEDDGRWLGAALMHDIGKLEANLATHERIAATLAGRAIGLSKAKRWAGGSHGFVRRLGLYLTHGAVGAEMIRRAGGREELAAWAEIHQAYRLPAESPVPAPVAQALSAADAD